MEAVDKESLIEKMYGNFEAMMTEDLICRIDLGSYATLPRKSPRFVLRLMLSHMVLKPFGPSLKCEYSDMTEDLKNINKALKNPSDEFVSVYELIASRIDVYAWNLESDIYYKAFKEHPAKDEQLGERTYLHDRLDRAARSYIEAVHYIVNTTNKTPKCVNDCYEISREFESTHGIKGWRARCIKKE